MDPKEKAKHRAKLATEYRKARREEKRKAADAATDANQLREKGYHVRRNRTHAATPPKLE